MKFDTNYKCLFFLIFIILFHTFNNIYFLSQDNLPLMSDTYNYYKGALNYYNEFKEGEVSAIFYQFFIPHDSFLLSNTIFYLFVFFGSSQDVASFSGTIFLAVLIIATYLLGKELFNRNVGLLAAILVSFSPFILAYSKVPYEDVPFTAMFALTLYFFLKSNKFSNIKYIWFFNLFLALTLLSKFSSFFVMFFIIISYLFFKIIFQRRDFKNFFNNFRMRQLYNFITSFFIFMLLPIRYFISMFSVQTANFFRYSSATDFNHGVSIINLVNIENIYDAFLIYLKTIKLNFEYASIFYIFIFSLTLFLLFYKKRNKLMILSLILGANLYHLFMSFFFMGKEQIPRYLVFIKPLYYIIISWFLVNFVYNLMNKILKKSMFKNIKNYFICLVILLLIIFIPFTLSFNYSDEIKDPLYLGPSFGKYHPMGLGFNITYLLDSMDNINMESDVLFLFRNHFVIDIFASYLYHDYENLKFIQLYIEDNEAYIRNCFNDKIEDYNFLVMDGDLNIEKIDRISYVILVDDLEILYINEYNVSYDNFFNHILDKKKFELFKKVSLQKPDISLVIYKNSLIND
jgi:4-amino-4-deoxy-L-arabinose transferase-like glycosyltransferase